MANMDHWFTGSPSFSDDRKYWDETYLKLPIPFGSTIPYEERSIGTDNNDWEVAWQFLVEFGDWLNSDKPDKSIKKPRTKAFRLTKI